MTTQGGGYLPPIIDRRGQGVQQPKPTDHDTDLENFIDRMGTRLIKVKAAGAMFDERVRDGDTHRTSEPAIRANLDLAEIMKSQAAQGTELLKIVNEQSKTHIASLIEQMKLLAIKSQNTQVPPDPLDQFTKFMGVYQDLVKEARDAVGVVSAGPVQSPHELSHLVELKKLDLQLEDVRQKNAQALEKMRQEFEMGMKRIDISLQQEERKQAFEEKKFETEISLKKQEFAAKQTMQSEAWAGVQDLLAGLTSGIDHEIGGAARDAGRDEIASRIVGRKIKESITCPGQGCGGTITLPPDLAAGQAVTCPTCNTAWTAE